LNIESKIINMKKLSFVLLAVIISFSALGQANIDSLTLKKHVYFLASDSLEGRGLATKSGLIAANYIADYFEESGLDMIGDSYFHTFHSRVGQTVLEGRNVVGIVEGSDPELKDEYIVLGAHYDHIAYRMNKGEKIVFNGADDNASGTSTVMEIGRALAQMKNKTKRSIVLVAFDAEESGLIGSGWFVTKEIVPIKQIKAMMSIDMVGRYAESGYVITGAMEDVEGGADILMPHAEKYDINIKKTGGSTSMRTDTKPFGDVGVPAIYVTSGIVGPYHKPEDDRETLDYPGMEKIAGMLLDLTVDLANQEEIVSNKEGSTAVANGKSPFIRIGFKANIGGGSNVYPNEFYKAKTGFAGQAGLTSQVRLTKSLFLQPEVLYSYMGSKHPDGKLHMHSVATPLSLLFSGPISGVPDLRLHASIGGYFGYHFAGTVDKKAIDFDNIYNPMEGGLVYGFGFEIGSVLVGMNFRNSLTNMLMTDDDKMRNRAVYFTIGKMFN